MFTSGLFSPFARGLLAGAIAAVGALAATSSASAACSDVEVIFARGSGELPGLGIVGAPFADQVKRNLPGLTVNVWAVNYAADVTQTSAGPGATALTNHLVEVAATCPETQFVLGGYSQGASVVDIALGVPNFLGAGKVIPAELEPRIKAIALFGNPLAITGGKVTKHKVWGARTTETCAAGDPVCGNGFNVFAHVSYPLDGSVAVAAKAAAEKITR